MAFASALAAARRRTRRTTRRRAGQEGDTEAPTRPFRASIAPPSVSVVSAEDIQAAWRERRERAGQRRAAHPRASRSAARSRSTPAGARVGVVNGLSVFSAGDVEFGQPMRITAVVGLGREGLVDVEREAQLGGSIHTKGVAILRGYLARMFGQERPLSPPRAARVRAELRRDRRRQRELERALRGAQRARRRGHRPGRGGHRQREPARRDAGHRRRVREDRGLLRPVHGARPDGAQGVLAAAGEPAAPRAARRRGRRDRATGSFHLYAVDTVAQGIEILTGRARGRARRDGRFPASSVFGRVERRIIEIAERLREAEAAHAPPTTCTRRSRTRRRRTSGRRRRTSGVQDEGALRGLRLPCCGPSSPSSRRTCRPTRRGASRSSTPTRRRRPSERCATRWRGRWPGRRSSGTRTRARGAQGRASPSATGARPDELLVGTGSDEVISLLLTALVAAAGAGAAGGGARAVADVRDVPGDGAGARAQARGGAARCGVGPRRRRDEARDRDDAAERRLRRQPEQPDGQPRERGPSRGAARGGGGRARRARRGVRGLRGRLAARLARAVSALGDPAHPEQGRARGAARRVARGGRGAGARDRQGAPAVQRERDRARRRRRRCWWRRGTRCGRTWPGWSASASAWRRGSARCRGSTSRRATRTSCGSGRRGRAADVHAALLARGVLVRSFHASGGRLATRLRVTIGAAGGERRAARGAARGRRVRAALAAILASGRRGVRASLGGRARVRRERRRTGTTSPPRRTRRSCVARSPRRSITPRMP